MEVTFSDPVTDTGSAIKVWSLKRTKNTDRSTSTNAK